MNPEVSEVTLPPLKRDYLGHANTLLLHRLGGDPSTQETLRIWDSGVRLKPGGQAVYLGQVIVEALVQRMRVFSYWSARPTKPANLERLAEEAAKLQIRYGDETTLLIRQPRKEGSQGQVSE